MRFYFGFFSSLFQFLKKFRNQFLCSHYFHSAMPCRSFSFCILYKYIFIILNLYVCRVNYFSCCSKPTFVFNCLNHLKCYVCIVVDKNVCWLALVLQNISTFLFPIIAIILCIFPFFSIVSKTFLLLFLYFGNHFVMFILLFCLLKQYMECYKIDFIFLFFVFVLSFRHIYVCVESENKDFNVL